MLYVSKPKTWLFDFLHQFTGDVSYTFLFNFSLKNYEKLLKIGKSGESDAIETLKVSHKKNKHESCYTIFKNKCQIESQNECQIIPSWYYAILTLSTQFVISAFKKMDTSPLNEIK